MSVEIIREKCYLEESNILEVKGLAATATVPAVDLDVSFRGLHKRLKRL